MLYNYYNNVPNYSWSVQVVTHEFGHLLGSKHTHACVWNGNNTAIDGCAGGTEGGCSTPGIPFNGGTIMSYCHMTSVSLRPIMKSRIGYPFIFTESFFCFARLLPLGIQIGHILRFISFHEARLITKLRY